MKAALVTGCNRGLGLSFAKHLAAGRLMGGFDKIYALVRDPTNTPDLDEAVGSEKLVKIKYSADDFEGLSKVVSEVKHDLDLVIHNAAKLTSKNGRSLFAGIEAVDPEDCVSSFRINTLGPLLLTRELSSKLKPGCVVAVISSVSGLISHDVGGGNSGAFAYGMSKAALNMVVSKLTHAYPDQFFVAMNPGGVRTKTLIEVADEMTKNWATPDSAALKLINILSKVDAAKMNGKFVNHRFLDENDPECGKFLDW